MSTLTTPAPTGTRTPSSARTRPAVRLTRRGRLLRTLLLAVVIVAAVAVAAVVWGPQVVATQGAGEPVPTRTVTVQPGQTLWDIADDVVAEQGGDPRAVVDAIQDLNAVTDPGTLQVGQELAVPRG